MILKNVRVQKEMVAAGLTQKEFAKILGVPVSEMCVMLKYELAPEEQRQLISIIKDYMNEEE